MTWHFGSQRTLYPWQSSIQLDEAWVKYQYRPQLTSWEYATATHRWDIFSTPANLITDAQCITQIRMLWCCATNRFIQYWESYSILLCDMRLSKLQLAVQIYTADGQNQCGFSKQGAFIGWFEGSSNGWSASNVTMIWMLNRIEWYVGMLSNSNGIERVAQLMNKLCFSLLFYIFFQKNMLYAPVLHQFLSHLPQGPRTSSWSSHDSLRQQDTPKDFTGN